MEIIQVVDCWYYLLYFLFQELIGNSIARQGDSQNFLEGGGSNRRIYLTVPESLVALVGIIIVYNYIYLFITLYHKLECSVLSPHIL